MRNIYLLVAFLLVVIWYYLRKLEAAQMLVLSYRLPQGISLKDGLTFRLPIGILNPTDTPINLQSYSVQIYAEGYPVGTAYSVQDAIIEAGQTTTIYANVSIPLMSLISAVPSLATAGKMLDFRFTGSLRAELLRIPIDTVVSFPVPKLNN